MPFPPFVAVLLSGIAAGVCFLPVNAGWLFWFVFIPFFWVIMDGRPRAAFLYGWIFGFSAWVVFMRWFVAPLAAFLRIPYPAALALFLCICAWHGLAFALLGWASRAGSFYLSKRLGWSRGAALFCAAIPAMSAIEGFFPLLFPVYFANTQYFHLPILQILELTGPAGLLWLILAFNISLYLLLRACWDRRSSSPGAAGLRGPAAFFCAACCLVLLNEFYGQVRMRSVDERSRDELARGRSVRVAVLQGSLPVAAAPGENNAEALALYRRMTAEAVKKDKPDLVIWPESVYGRFAEFSPAGGKYGFTAAFAGTLRRDVPEKAAMIMSSRAELVDPSEGGSRVRFNSVYAVSPEKELLGIVLKRRLFPFGEFIPGARIFPSLYRLVPNAERLTPAGEPWPIAAVAVWGALICYEDLYADTAGVFVRKGADVLLDVSNEIGFGYDTVSLQHLRYSALRAIENRKFFIRAANTGVSAVFDPCGRLLDSVDTGKRGTMTAAIALLDGSTFYARHDALFRFSGLAVLAVVFLFALIIPPGRF